jgi:hypothetical protein
VRVTVEGATAAGVMVAAVAAAVRMVGTNDREGRATATVGDLMVKAAVETASAVWAMEVEAAVETALGREEESTG